MAEPEYKIGDIVTAVTFCGEQIFFAVTGIKIQKDGSIFYFAPGLQNGYSEEDVVMVDSQKNKYDRICYEAIKDYTELLSDFRTVAKILAERDPELGSWLLWCKNKSGYTGDVSMAGLYSPEDFTGKYEDVPVVKMRKDLVKHYCKKYDSVLVDKDEFVQFISNLRNCTKQESIDTTKTVLHAIECILTSETIEPEIRIEKALARIREIRRSN